MKKFCYAKRLLSLLLVIMVLAVTGCSNKSDDGKDSTPTGKPSGTVGDNAGNEETPDDGTPSQVEAATIYWWTAWTPEAGIQDIIDKFNESYPQIEVIPVQFSNNVDGNLKVDVTLSSGSGIDVFFNFGADRINSRAQNDLLLDLSSYIEQDGFDVENELGKDIYTLDGKYYALPATSNAYAVFLNKDMLDEAGLTTPTQWTMEEYYEYARKMTSGSGDTKIYGSDAMRPYYQWLFMASNSFAANPWYNEAGVSNFDHPYYAKALELKYNAENVEGIQYPYTESVSTKASPVDNFLNGKAAMVMYGNALARNLADTEKYPHDFSVEVAPLPVAEEGAENYNIGGYFGYMGINAKTAEPDASWLFLKYLVTEGSYGFLKVGHIPTWKNTDWDAVVDETFNNNAEALINVEQFKNVILNQANMPQQSLTNFTAYSKITAIFETEFEGFIYGQNDIRTTINNLKAQADAAILAGD